jgi:RecJ-like exonuclease
MVFLTQNNWAFHEVMKPLLDCAMRAAHREAEMVCAVCNGKGYVIEKHRESVCNECQGRGECLLNDRDRDRKRETQHVLELLKTEV